MPESREPANFYARWAWRTIDGPWGVTGVAGTILSLVIPGCIRAIPELRDIEAEVNSYIWIVPLVLFGSLALFRFFVAPWSIWRDERRRAEQAELKLKPSLSLVLGTGPQYVQLVTADENETPQNEFHRLVFINTGAEPVQDVRAYVQTLNGSELSFGPLELPPSSGDGKRPVTAFNDVKVAFTLVEHSYDDDHFIIPCRERYLRLKYQRHELVIKVSGSHGTTLTLYVAIDATNPNRITVAVLDKPTDNEQRLTPLAYGEWRAKDEVLEENRQLRAELEAVRPRRLTEEQMTAIRGAVAPVNDETQAAGQQGRQVSVFWTGAGDCADYARQFEDLFDSMGLRLHFAGNHGRYNRDCHYGLWVIWNSAYEEKFPRSLGQALCDALTGAGIEFTSVDTVDVNVARLVIGARHL